MKSKGSQSNAAQKSPTRPNVRQPLPHEQGGTRANAPTRPPLATQNSKAVQQKPSQARPAATPPRASTPAAPPVYRPQPTPAVLQRKEPAGRPQGRANQTPTQPAAANVPRRHAAPPVYRPQTAPKVLQKKPALPNAAATSPAPVKPPAGLRQTPAPPQAPRAFQPPAARVLHAQPARLNVLQRAEVNYDQGSGSGEDEGWDYEAQVKALKEFSKQKKAKQLEEKASKSTSSKSAPQSTLSVTANHLDDDAFDTGMVDKMLSRGETPDANQVTIVLKVNGTPVGGGGGNNEHDADITSPSAESCVTNSIKDGEVALLVSAMRAFLAHLKKPKNQDSPQNFTVALYGYWGACDGCKRRIIRFVQLWEMEARKYMKEGVAATLKVTYRYLKYAKGFKRTWGTNVYGWAEDGHDKMAHFDHTFEARVSGANKG